MGLPVVTMWPPFKRSGTNITQRIANDTVTLALGATGNGLILNKTATTYTDGEGALKIVRSGNFTFSTFSHNVTDLLVAPSFVLTEQGSGTSYYQTAHFNASGVSVTAGAGTTIVSALRITGGSDADTTNYAIYVDSGTRSWFEGEITIDQTSTTAFHVQKENSAGDVFTVDSTNSKILLGQVGSIIDIAGGDITITHSANNLAFAGALLGYSFADGTLTSGGTNDYILNLSATLNDSGAAGGSDYFRGIKMVITETNVTGWNNTDFFEFVSGGASIRGTTQGNLFVTSAATIQPNEAVLMVDHSSNYTATANSQSAFLSLNGTFTLTGPSSSAAGFFGLYSNLSDLTITNGVGALNTSAGQFIAYRGANGSANTALVLGSTQDSNESSHANAQQQQIFMPGITNGIGAATYRFGLIISGDGTNGNLNLGNQTATLDNFVSLVIDNHSLTSTTNVRTVTQAIGASINAPTAASSLVEFETLVSLVLGTENNTIYQSSADATIADFLAGGNVVTLGKTTNITTGLIGTVAFLGKTINQSGGAVVVTDAATVFIDGAMTAGASVTLTNNHALWVGGGTIRFDGALYQNDAIYFTQADGNEKIDSAADGYLDYTVTTAHRFNMAVANTDVRLEFVGTSNSGLLEWMEDEDYFRFGDSILMNGGALTVDTTKTNNVITKLGSATGVDMKTIAATNLFTVPTGKIAVITHAIVRITASTNPTVVAQVSVGKSAGYTEWKNTITLTSVDTPNEMMILTAENTNAQYFVAADVLGIKVQVGATADSETGAFELFGYLLDA